MTATPPPAPPQHQAALAALQDAALFYRAEVDRSWVPDYLNRRNLYAQLQPAELGYAPAGWTTTTDHLIRNGYSPATLQAAGLARPTAQGRLVDVFRDRLMIPLTNANGVLVGFTGRAAPNAEVPKYLNSPASEVFVKHDLLYGLAEDAHALHHGAMLVLVEGPLDRLALSQAAGGLAVVGVAPCGTAFSPSQAALLLQTVGKSRPIAVALDPDAAGRAATRHAWQTLTDAGAKHLRHIELPGGKDPADLVRNGRGNLLRRAITHNRPLAHAVADNTISDLTVTSNRDWQRDLTVARRLFRQDLRRIPSDQVAGYVAHIAARLQLELEDVTAAAANAVTGGPASP